MSELETGLKALQADWQQERKKLLEQVNVLQAALDIIGEGGRLRAAIDRRQADVCRLMQCESDVIALWTNVLLGQGHRGVFCPPSLGAMEGKKI